MKKYTLKQVSDSLLQLFIGDDLFCNLVLIPEGSFMRDDDRIVNLNAFYMSQFPVTQHFYEEVIGDNPSSFKGRKHPVEQVSWYDAVKFCGKLNNQFKGTEPFRNSELIKLHNQTDKQLDTWKLNPASSGFRLPTEAEWEYAAMGSQHPIYKSGKSLYAGSNTLDLVGWYINNDGCETRAVGLKFPNAFGLYDMSGNVWEWCWDWRADYDQKRFDNPAGADSGSSRVLHGGSWFSGSIDSRAGYRNFFNPLHRYYRIGFRLAFVP